MLLGRERELAELRRLLDGARAGHGGAILIVGDAGIGKTALWRAAVAEAADLRPLEAQGIEAESQLAFAGLRDLLAPVLSSLELLPPPQRVALTGALALGPPAPGDPFAVAAATLGLLAASAPAVAVVDDAHWLDPPSIEAILFAARRLRGEGVALIMTARAGEGIPVARSDLRSLELAGLDDDAAREMVRRSAPGARSDVTEAVVRAAGGNPLALEEIPRAVREEAGGRSLPDPLPVGPNLLSVVSRRLEPLPTATRQALVVVAASGAGEIARVRAALAALGYAPDVLEPGEQAEILELRSGRMEFRHPLLRAGAYGYADAPARRAAHEALAAVLDGDPERRAWHLAAASSAPDERVAGELERVAEAVAARGAGSTAALALERAAELTPGGRRAAERRLNAAQLAVQAGRLDWCIELLDAIPGADADPILRAEAENLRGTILRARGSTMQARRHQRNAAAAVESADPERAALIAINAAASEMMGGDLPACRESASWAVELAPATASLTRRMAHTMLDLVLYLMGERPVSERLLPTEWQGENIPTRLGIAGAARIAFELLTTTWVFYTEGEPAKPLESMAQTIGAAREAGAFGFLPYELGNQAELLCRAGELRAAAESAREGVEIARDTGNHTFLAWALTNLARAEAVIGHDHECLTHLRETHEIARALELGSIRTHCLAIEGRLHLGALRIDASLETFEQLERLVQRQALAAPAVVQWRPDYVEALARSGQAGPAEQQLAILEEQAERCDSGWARAAAARCRLLLCEDDELDAQHELAAVVVDPVGSPFDLARRELCYGERLRRAGRRRDAVPPLSHARELFEHIGAAPWAARARSALGGMGERLGESLTAAEVEVARLVGGGASNKEVAATLYITPKTVEAHLTRIYRKLGVRRRGQLASFASGQEMTDAGAGM